MLCRLGRFAFRDMRSTLISCDFEDIRNSYRLNKEMTNAYSRVVGAPMKLLKTEHVFTIPNTHLRVMFVSY